MSSTNYISLLVFSDGIVLPTFYSVRYDERWMAIAQIVNTFKYIDEIAGRIGGTDPLSLLTFGYSGTGSKCFAAFLGAAGFLSTDVEKINPPLRLRPDGSKVRGTWHGETVQWKMEVRHQSHMAVIYSVSWE